MIDRDFNSQDVDNELVQEDSSVLMSVGDLMSGLLMIFALLFIVVYVQYQDGLKKEQELRAKVERYEEILQNLPEVIRSRLEKELGKTGNFRVDPQTGDLQIGDRILFTENSAVLNESGKEFLRKFIPIYSKIIFSLPPELSGEISRIAIEGSTSSSGTDKENMDLSLQRSASVYHYIFNDPTFPNFPTKEQLRKKMVVAGRGKIDADLRSVRAIDRQVTFKFQIKRPNFLQTTKK